MSEQTQTLVAAPVRKRRLRLRDFNEITVPAITLIAVVILWELASRLFDIPEYLVPAPSRIWADSMQMKEAMLMHTLVSTRTIMLGFLLSIVVSFPLAVLITYSRFFEQAIYPLLILTQSIPKVALAPILVIIFGPTELPRVVVTFLVAFFPLVISMTAGLLAAPPELIELVRACRATRMQEFFRIRLPFAVPFIFSGLKVAITLSVVGAVVGEFVAADQGLGYLITTSTAFFKTPVAFGAMAILSVLGIVFFQVISAAERILFPWAIKDNQSGS
ncbi:ABC transporter permease [Alcaligenes aquatilis]|uniref:ABC transporter permease n=1 Tax=Alcaligenes aquatilis TaxID=323284 RepID=UPI003208668B